MQAKNISQIEISDLIADAVSSAVERRSQGLETEASLTTLSEDEIEAIRGGQRVPVVVTSGAIFVPEEVI